MNKSLKKVGLATLAILGGAGLIANASATTHTVTNVDGEGMHLVGIYSTDETRAQSIPIKGAHGTYSIITRRVVGPIEPGDVLDITMRGRVTNDTHKVRGDKGYTVGVGYHPAAYEINETGHKGSNWFRLSPHFGDNVTVQRHHMPLIINAIWQAPEDWPDSRRINVAFRADAASTAWIAGDTLTVDHGYSLLVIRHWRKDDES